MLKISNKALFFYVAVVMAVSSLIIAGAYTSYGNYDNAAPNPGHYATEVWVGLLDGSEKTLQQAIDSEEIGGRAPGFLPGIYNYHTDDSVTLNADYATRSSTTLSTKCSEGEYLDGTGNCYTAEQIIRRSGICEFSIDCPDGEAIHSIDEEGNVECIPLHGSASIERCNDAEQVKTKTVNLNFPAVNTACEWGVNGNMDKKANYIRARREQVRTVTIPKNARLCGMEMKSSTDEIFYDDNLYLNLDDYILMTSCSRLKDYFEKEGELYKGDFFDIRNKKGVREKQNCDPYCLGDSEICQVPESQHRGNFDIVFDRNSIFDISSTVTQDGEMDFKLSVAGDNNNKDCTHSSIDFEVVLHYVI